VNENSAAVAADARAGVMVDFDDQIVKPIGTLQTIAWFIGRPPERTVIAPVFGVFAPGIVRRYSPDRQQGTRVRQAIRTPPQPDRMKLAGGRRAIAFAFCRPDACPTQSRANRALPHREPSLPAQSRADVQMDCGQRGLTYCLAHWAVFSSRHELSQGSQAQLFQVELISALTFCGHMIFSENRFPLCRIML
jgi:hypothetical protein